MPLFKPDGWSLLGSVTLTGSAVTCGPVIWSGTYTSFYVEYVVTGYSNVALARFLMGAASISTTTATNGSVVRDSIGAGTSAISIPGCPLAGAAGNVARSGIIAIRGASGGLKSYEITGSNGNLSVSAARTTFEASGSFSDLGTNLPIQRMQLTSYDLVTGSAPSAITLNAGTYLKVWGAP